MLLTLLADGDADLVQIAEPEGSLDTDVWILTHAELKQVPRIRLFTNFMHERCARAQPS
jgi:hypothetical protein